ncbi:MAG: ANTAR domain-containing protein [Eubacteriales bacterium]|nr:ANTAR domain-containing protein [Eubacteriales bacterium]
MGTLFIVMSKYEDSSRIAGIVRPYVPYLKIEICKTGAEVLRMAPGRENGLILCSKRLQDMTYINLADYMPHGYHMIVMTKDVSLETFSDRVIKLMLPLKKRDLLSTIEMLTENFQMQTRRRKKEAPKRNKEEQRIIDQAKAMLMEKHGMTEPEAFRYLQKNSMDYSRSMVETAQMIRMIIDGS